MRLWAEKSSHSFLGKSLSANFVSCHSILKGMLAYSFANHICSTKYATNAQLVMALIFLRNIKWASKTTIGNSLVVQWLELFTFTGKCVDSVLGWGTKILKVTLCSQNKQTKKIDCHYLSIIYATSICQMPVQSLNNYPEVIDLSLEPNHIFERYYLSVMVFPRKWCRGTWKF